MKVLTCHNYYQVSGGEDKVFELESRLLESRGHTVVKYTRDNQEEIKGVIAKIRLMWNTHYSTSSKHQFAILLRDIMPDVVHVHNFFPLLTPSIFDACQECGVPVVMTLHNYRLVYPNGLLLDNNNSIDLRTIKGSVFQTIKDKVYRNSYFQTLVVAFMIDFHKRKNTWNKKVDKLICLTEFSKSIFLQSGIEENQLVVKPNFLIKEKKQNIDKKIDSENGFIFIGRLSQEKGILQLVEYWITHDIREQLIVVGGGEYLEELINKVQDHERISLTGPVDNEKAIGLLKKSKALIFPSIWYEGFPMTILEAFSLGKPVISTNIGSQSTIVKDGYNGFLYDPDDSSSLKDAIDKLQKQEVYCNLCNNSLEDFEKNYNEEVNYHRLIEIYKSVQRK